MLTPILPSLGLGGACCTSLLSALGGKILLSGSTAYNASLASYFSAQEEALKPTCIVMPDTAHDVAIALRTMTSPSLNMSNIEHGGCQFAIRSGGHTMFAGAANIDEGVTIDLQGLNSIQVSNDNSTVSVGPGVTWDEIYKTLDPLGLSVAGGRAAGVGVGGLSLGGGISFFSPRYGWTFDTVSNFQIVLANGSILDTNLTQNPALFKALKGGSNNFGVVTRVDIQTFEQGLMWGGKAYHPMSTIDVQIREFVKINSADDYDEYASLVTSFGYSTAMGSAIFNQPVYTKSLPNPPPIFETLLELPTLLSTVRLTNMTDLAMETGAFQVHGVRFVSLFSQLNIRFCMLKITTKSPNRHLYLVSTVHSTAEVLKAIYQSFNTSLSHIQGVEGIVWSVTLEPLPPAIYARHAASNSLGLANRTEALAVVLVTADWNDAADDGVINEAANSLIADIDAQAKKLGSWDPYIYLNYATASQDPISSYGQASVENLQEIRNAFDPAWVFTRNVPGGFKIPARKA
ncbi:putative oxidoreductase [Rostrohypoxylon terebratum]|nr:putative oxidoreductase [Rostrohypoxylon terebratum]